MSTSQLLTNLDFIIQNVCPSKKGQNKKKLRAKALDLIFQPKFRSNKDEDLTVEALDDLNPIDQTYAACYDLRLKRRFDNANRLEYCLDKLKQNHGEHGSIPKDDPVLSVLRLLVLLKGECSHEQTAADLPEKIQTQYLYEEHDDMPKVFPHGPWFFGDSSLPNPQSRHFTQYPANVFQRQFKCDPEPGPNSIFSKKPGEGLEWFNSNKSEKGDLFGSLLTKNELSSDLTTLSIPPLKSLLTEDGRHLRVPRSTHRTHAEDEGYVSPDNTIIPGDSKDEEDKTEIWEKVWEVEAPKRRTWEAFGSRAPPKEKPYLSEMGDEAVLHTWVVAMRNLTLLDATIHVPKVKLVEEKDLVQDVGLLLIGIASETFNFDEELGSFQMDEGLCISGVTPDAIRSYCEEFILCGNWCRKLESFCDQRRQHLTDHGLIFKGLLNGITKFLQIYRSTTAQLIKKRKLVEISAVFRMQFKQVRFLAHLCRVDNDEDPLPMGIRLLCYLFDETLHITTKDMYFILVSILRSSAEPYFRFLERWMFHGIFYDGFEEFGLTVNPTAFYARDRDFWTDAYQVADIPHDTNVCGGGNFIADVQQQVFVCGKALALLKLCLPSHHLCASVVPEQPSINLLVSPIQESELKEKCSTYILKMNALADAETLTLKKQKKLEEEKKRELLRLAHQKHKENLDRLRKERNERIEAREMKKRKQLESLKKQARMHKEKKAEEKKKLEEEDKKWMEKMQRKADEEIRLEAEAKAQTEAFYKSLSDAAEKRERIAQWRVRRMELRSDRIRFWREDNRKMQQMAMNNARDKETMAKTSSEFKSVRISEDEMKNIVITIEDQESNVVCENITNLSDFSTELQQQMLTQTFTSLPSWVQKKLVERAMNQTRFEVESEDDEVVFNENLRRSDVSTRSSSKRKRPLSFIESEEKKRSPLAASKKKDSLSDLVQGSGTMEESLAYSLRPKDQKASSSSYESTVDGRKRPTSKPIEEILYPTRFSSVHSTPFEFETTDIEVNESKEVLQYSKSVDGLFKREMKRDFSHHLIHPQPAPNADPQAFTPLSILMENSILIPLRAQTKVVNEAILNHLLVDQKLLDHFNSLRNYILFHDGEFGHHLTFGLFQTISEAKSPSEVLNPATLNRIADNAMMSSTRGNVDPFAENVGFTFKSDSAADIVDCIELRYKTSWPNNVILTKESIDKYVQIFQFLVHLKKAVWSLDQVFTNLKKNRKFQWSPQYKKIQLMRHEMLNFMMVIQGYVTTQVLDVSWIEFENDMQNRVDSVDSLYDAHLKYLNKALFRCLLNKKAKPLQKIMRDLFLEIVQFSSLLTSRSWEHKGSKIIEHPAFDKLVAIYKQFQEHSTFLYKVVNKLAQRGYQHHMFDLLLRLNYNEYYQTLA